MADPNGIYDRFLNGALDNASADMRNEATEVLFKMYDDKFQPQMVDLFPKTVAPAQYEGGPTPSIHDQFFIRTGVNPQGMARPGHARERRTPKTWGMEKEWMQGRPFNEWGPTTNPFVFDHEIKSGLLGRVNQKLVQFAFENIARRIEFELVEYVQCQQAVLDYYGDQYTKQGDRFKVLDATEAVTTEADYLSGTRWDDHTNSDIIDQLSLIQLFVESMGQVTPTEGYIGPNTAYHIMQNEKMQSFKKYHSDLVANPLNISVGGFNMHRVVGLTYKTDSAMSGRVGYPGFGNLNKDNWTTRSMTHMMRDAAAVDGIDTEWAIFTPGQLGNTYCVRTLPQHNNPLVPYGHSWTDVETQQVYSTVSIGIAPHVDDFADYTIVKNIAKCRV